MEEAVLAKVRRVHRPPRPWAQQGWNTTCQVGAAQISARRAQLQPGCQGHPPPGRSLAGGGCVCRAGGTGPGRATSEGERVPGARVAVLDDRGALRCSVLGTQGPSGGRAVPGKSSPPPPRVHVYSPRFHYPKRKRRGRCNGQGGVLPQTPGWLAAPAPSHRYPHITLCARRSRAGHCGPSSNERRAPGQPRLPCTDYHIEGQAEEGLRHKRSEEARQADRRGPGRACDNEARGPGRSAGCQVFAQVTGAPGRSGCSPHPRLLPVLHGRAG